MRTQKTEIAINIAEMMGVKFGESEKSVNHQRLLVSRRYMRKRFSGGGYSHILAIRVCAAGKGMVFKPFGLV